MKSRRIALVTLYALMLYLIVLSSGLRVFWFSKPDSEWLGLSMDRPQVCILYIVRGDDRGYTWRGDC